MLSSKIRDNGFYQGPLNRNQLYGRIFVKTPEASFHFDRLNIQCCNFVALISLKKFAKSPYVTSYITAEVFIKQCVSIAIILK
jgi:hypothetical protein